MPGITNLEIKLDGIGHVLADKKLTVPEYQRSYAWERDHVQDLFRDVYGAYQNKEPEYFLGSVVLTTVDNNRLEVVDGQQRLATASLFVSALCGYLNIRGEQKRAEILVQEYLQKLDARTLRATPQLELNAQDNAFFQALITSVGQRDQPRPERESHRRILVAYRSAASFIDTITKNARNPVDHLLDFLEFFAKASKVIVAQVPDDRNAWIIFETLNDRGLALSTTDLLKNYLFGKAGDRLNEVRKNWIEMTALLETFGGESLVLLFLRHMWASYHGLTRERELFDKVKNIVATKEAAADFSYQLVSNAKLYAAMLNPTEEFWAPFGNATKASLATLLELGFTQPRPLMLAAVSAFKPPDCAKLFRCLLACSVRFTIVGVLGSSALESFYANQAAAIRAGEIKTVDDLIRNLGKEAPTDDHFKSAFAAARVSSPAHARYYLRALELAHAGKGEPEFIPNADVQAVTLEHVLPRNPEQGTWNDFDEDGVEAYAKRLGNLVLLTRGANVGAGNAEFKRKRELLAKSEFTLTQRVSAFEKWDRKTIEQRQVELASLAVKSWPLAAK